MNYRMMLVTGEIMRLPEADYFEERGKFTIVQKTLKDPAQKVLLAMVPTDQIVYVAEESSTVERTK